MNKSFLLAKPHQAPTSTQARVFGRLLSLVLGSMLLTACGGGSDSSAGNGDASALPPVDASTVDTTEVMAGGQLATVDDTSADAFARSAPGLGFIGKSLFENGNHLFRTPRGRERGTGPILNAQSCQGCHVLDGKGNPPRSTDQPLAPQVDMVSMLMRLARAGTGEPDPVYGAQLQIRSLYGGADDPDGKPVLNGSLNGGPALGEAKARVIYEPINGAYPDGTPYELLNPVYQLSEFAYGPMSEDIRVSPRVTPGVFGNGLLGAIDGQAIRDRADPDDANSDGVSGRANEVSDPVTGEMTLGRFGLKATTTSVLTQSAGAYRGDMGLTNSLARQEPCTEAQTACVESSNQEQEALREPGVDVANIEMAQVEFYVRTLAVPKRRGWNADTQQWSPEIQRGREQFFAADCASCHTPRWQTGTATGSILGDASTLTSLVKPAPSITALSNQVIWPFTNMLLHDMGGSCEVTRKDADGQACTDDMAGCVVEQRCTGLADGVKANSASASEWRTAPLWGLGLVQRVNPAAGFLHDGRARTIEEAILWHGQSAESEAATSTEKYKDLPKNNRAAIITFLKSL